MTQEIALPDIKLRSAPNWNDLAECLTPLWEVHTVFNIWHKLCLIAFR